MKTRMFLAATTAAFLSISPAQAATIILNGDGFRIPPAGSGPGESTETETAMGAGRVTGLVLTLNNLRHSFVGDLQFVLSHRNTSVTFANFFGARNDTTTGGADLNGTYTIFDSASPVFQTAPGDPIPSGDYRPNGNNLFANFNGLASGGDWTLTVRDRLATDAGRLGSWQLAITTDRVTAAVPEPATWAMMLIGFGAIGGATRYRRRKSTVSFA